VLFTELTRRRHVDLSRVASSICRWTRCRSRRWPGWWSGRWSRCRASCRSGRRSPRQAPADPAAGPGL